MTTTEPTSSAETPKKEHSIMDAIKRGRELATAMVLVLTFFHSMYASYFKKEEVAEAGYKQTSETIEGYSRVVHDEIEILKERTQVLEADLAKAKAEIPDGQALKVRKNRKPPVVHLEGVQVEGHPVGFPVAMVDNPASLSELIQVDADGLPDVDGAEDIPDSLIVNMPDRPWEQVKK